MNAGYYIKQLNDGEHPYKLIYFEIKLLRDILDDPRYFIHNSFFKYNISIKEQYDNDEKIDGKNKIVLDNIGLGFDENNERIFAVFLNKLSELHPEMQERFKTYEVKNKTYLDSSFIKSINGKWSNPSIFNAILYQIELINKISSDTETTLFKSDYKNNTPQEFNILILSTKREYNDFIKTFDIMLSDNINIKFFKEKQYPMESIDKNGIKQKKGTITLLKVWLKDIGVSEETINKTIKIIKKIRKQRSKPSHNTYENVFDINYLDNQIKILSEVYNAFRLLINEINKIKQIDVEYPEWYIENSIIMHSLKEIKNKTNENYQLPFI